MVSKDFESVKVGIVIGQGASACVFLNEQGQAVKHVFSKNLFNGNELLAREAHYLNQLQSEPYCVPNFYSVSHQSTKQFGKMTCGSIVMENARDSKFVKYGDIVSAEISDTQKRLYLKSAAALLAKIHKSSPRPMSGDYRVLVDTFNAAYAIDPYRKQRQAFYNALTPKLMNIEGASEPVFCHGDFIFNNMMLNKSTEQFEGVIDLANAGYSIPETDLRHMKSLPKELRDVMFSEYHNHTGYKFNDEKLNMVDLVYTLKHLVSALNISSYPNKEQQILALEGRLIRLAEGFNVYYPNAHYQPSDGFFPK